jgi:hypothetical protein
MDSIFRTLNDSFFKLDQKSLVAHRCGDAALCSAYGILACLVDDMTDELGFLLDENLISA